MSFTSHWFRATEASSDLLRQFFILTAWEKKTFSDFFPLFLINAMLGNLKFWYILKVSSINDLLGAIWAELLLNWEFCGSHASIALPTKSRLFFAHSKHISYSCGQHNNFIPLESRRYLLAGNGIFNSFFSLFSSSRQKFVTRFPLSLELNLYANIRQTPASWRHQLTCQLVWI